MTAQLAALMNAVLRVLIVEDDTRYRGMLVTMLRDLACEPFPMASANEALDWLCVNHADLIVLDLNIPRMDGLEFLELLRRRDQAMPVIILTGVGTLRAAQVAIQHGVSDFLTKPCHLGTMEAALDRVRRRLALHGRGSPERDASSREIDGAFVDADEHAQAPGPHGTLADLERRAILAALREHRGNRSSAAAALGISRRTMHYRLAEYRRSGVPLTSVLPDDDDRGVRTPPA